MFAQSYYDAKQEAADALLSLLALVDDENWRFVNDGAIRCGVAGREVCPLSALYNRFRDDGAAPLYLAIQSAVQPFAGGRDYIGREGVGCDIAFLYRAASDIANAADLTHAEVRKASAYYRYLRDALEAILKPKRVRHAR